MLSHSLRLIQTLAIAASLTLPAFAQNTASPAPHTSNPAAQPPFAFHSTTRMVNLELVVKDSKGNKLTGLKAEDFQIEEQTPKKNNKWSAQKIAEFREVRMAGLTAPVAAPPQMPPGAYTNALTLQKDPVPPTVLLVDGLNTDVKDQAQVHVQMLKMLRQLPPNVPVAVFLLGGRLEMLQGFTTDPKLLQEALSKAISTAGVGLATIYPSDDPSSASNLVGGQHGDGESGDSHAAGVAASLEAFEKRIFSIVLDERVGRTINALTSLGHNLSGYPGRKNLLWLSTTFPITLRAVNEVGSLPEGRPASIGPVSTGVIHPSEPETPSFEWASLSDYKDQLQTLSAVFSDAKIAVYPVNVSGVGTLHAYQSSMQPPDVTAVGLSHNTLRDVIMQNSSVDTMQEVAEDTGGIVCTGDNDLGDCVRKAVDDSSDFYEIAYYSNSPDWNGDFRKIAVKTALHGAHLEYRQGYFANPDGSPGSKAESTKLQSDCNDYLDATSIVFIANNLPADAPGQLKFALLIDATPLTVSPTADGGHQMNLDVAVCTYNEKHWPLKVLDYPVNLKLNAQQLETVMSTGKLTDTLRIPGPAPAAIRLLVKDVPSGKVGSISIKTSDLVANAPKAEGSAK